MAKEATRTPKKPKKFEAAMICPLFSWGLKIWIKVSSGTMKMPPQIPRRVKKLMVKMTVWEKRERQIKKRKIKRQERHEIASSTLLWEAFPAIKEPRAMPMAVVRKRYPPATLDRPSSVMANGIMLSCVKAPMNRK